MYACGNLHRRHVLLSVPRNEVLPMPLNMPTPLSGVTELLKRRSLGCMWQISQSPTPLTSAIQVVQSLPFRVRGVDNVDSVGGMLIKTLVYGHKDIFLIDILLYARLIQIFIIVWFIY
jgi:hypothetical protein